MPLGDFFNEQYTFALKMNGLGLSDGEMGLLTAIMIMNPGQSDLLCGLTMCVCVLSVIMLMTDLRGSVKKF